MYGPSVTSITLGYLFCYLVCMCWQPTGPGLVLSKGVVRPTYGHRACLPSTDLGVPSPEDTESFRQGLVMKWRCQF